MCRGIDWGFSNIFCVRANSYRQSAARFIASQRQSINGLRFVRKGRLRQVGRLYFRQTFIVTAGRGRNAGKGQLVFDYAAADGAGNYQDTCPKCRRAQLALAQSARVGGFG